MNDNGNSGAAARTLPDLNKTSPEQWKAYSLELLGEIDRLQSDIQMLRTQRRELLDLLVPDRHRHYDIDDETFFADMETSPSIQEIIAEHAKSHGK